MVSVPANLTTWQRVRMWNHMRKRAAAEKLLQLPPGHILMKRTPIRDDDDGEPYGSGTIRSRVPMLERAVDRYAKAGNFHYSSLTEQYEQYESRAQAQGNLWQENARTAYGYFETEVWVYACVRALMTAGASVRGEFYRYPDDKNREERIPYHSHIADKILDTPNEFQSFPDLIEEIIAYGALTGMALLDIGDRIAGRKLLNSIWTIQPDALYPWGNNDTLMTDWHYQDAYGKTKTVEDDNIAWLRHFRPAIARLGMGRVQPAGAPLKESASIREWSTNFFENNAEPLGWIEYPKQAHKSVIKMLRDQWAAIHSGRREMGVLAGGAKYHESTSASGRKGDFIDLRKESRLEILATFGVTPVMLGITENINFANAKEQKAVFWENTMAPELRRIERMITRQVCPFIGPGVRYRFKLEDIPHLDPGKDAREKSWRDEVAAGLMSHEEYRSRVGYGEKNPDDTFAPPPGAGLMFTEGKTSDDDDDPTGGDTGGSTPPPADEPDKLPTPEAPAVNTRQNAITPEQAEQLRQEFHARQAEHVPALIDEFRPVWERMRDAVLDAMQDQVTLSHARATARIARSARVVRGVARMQARCDIMKSISLDEILASLPRTEFANLEAILNRSGLDIMTIEGEAVLANALGQSPSSFNLAEAVILDWAEHQAGVMQGIQSTTEKLLTQTIADGVLEGEALRDLRLRVESVFDRMGTSATPSHAAMVARTEAHAAQNYGALEGYVIGGVEEKEWLAMPVGTSISGSERTGHQAASGQIVRLREPFMVAPEEGGFVEALQFPGDPSGSFGNTHNCRCVSLPVLRQ